MDLFKEIVDIFLDDYPRILSEIRNAILNGDSKTLERAAHSIKGSTGNLSAIGAYKAAFKLEEIGRSCNISKAEIAYKELEKEIEQLKPVLKEYAVQ